MNNERASTVIRSDRWSYLWLVVAAILMLVSNGRWIVPLAAWLMPVFAIRFLRTQNAVWGFILLVVVSYVTSVVAWWGVQPLPFPLNLILTAFTVLLASLPFLIDRLLAPRLPGYAATLIFPLALTAFEFVSLGTNPMGTWSATAYTQYGNPPLMQLASLTGLWGFPFLMGWFASVVNWAWERDFDWSRIRRGAALYAGVLLLVLAYGSARLLFTPPHVGTVRVASLTAFSLAAEGERLAQAMESDKDTFRRMTRDFHERYFAGTIREAQAGAKIVFWAEGGGLADERDEAALIARGQEIARQEGIYLALPLFIIYQDPGRPAENKLLVVDPAGDVVLQHVKYGGNIIEGTLLGDGVLRTVETPYGTLSGVICWDADFPLVISQAGRNGTDILLVPSNDWPEIDPLHTRMAVFRAIENGTSLVRHVSNGLSMAVDPYGRELAQMDYFTASDQVMVAQVPTGGVLTLYPYTLDAVGWLAIVGFVVVAGWTVVRWWKARRIGSPEPKVP